MPTQRALPSERIRLLDEGADDDVTKPFSPAELEARIRVQLPRSRSTHSPGEDDVVLIADLEIDPGARPVTHLRQDAQLELGLLMPGESVMDYRHQKTAD